VVLNRNILLNQAINRTLFAIPIFVLIAALVAIAGSQGSYEFINLPIFVLCVATAYLIQSIAFIPAFTKQTGSFYDLTGSITTLTVVWVTLLLRSENVMRSFLLATTISLWALRLGTFLSHRIRAAGSDDLFR
jgi:steroid 5-alpha reductase family enzyme